MFVEAEDLQELQKKKDTSKSSLSELSVIITSDEGKHKSILPTVMWMMLALSMQLFSLYINMYQASSQQGNKMSSGITFGLAEASACLFSGYICKKVKDTTAFIFFSLLCVISMTVYYVVCGGVTDGPLSLVMFFLGTFGVGSNTNIMYLMMELRIPAEKLGSVIVVVFTGAVFIATFSPNIAYTDQPVPYITQVIMISVSVSAVSMLPPSLKNTQRTSKPLAQRVETSMITSRSVKKD